MPPYAKDNFQFLAQQQGRDFEEEGVRALTYAGLRIVEQHLELDDVGIEIDVVTENEYGIAMPWELKGSLRGRRPSIVRTDTLKKMVANAVLLRASPKYSDFFPQFFSMVSHIPKRGRARKMLDTAMGTGLLPWVVDSRDGETLRWLATADEEALDRRTKANIARYAKKYQSQLFLPETGLFLASLERD